MLERPTVVNDALRDLLKRAAANGTDSADDMTTDDTDSAGEHGRHGRHGWRRRIGSTGVTEQ